MARLTATEVARNFSDVLNRIARGEEISITRNGATVAVLGPPRATFVSADRFRDLMAAAPPVDEGFAEDLRAVRADLGPPEGVWPS